MCFVFGKQVIHWMGLTPKGPIKFVMDGLSSLKLFIVSSASFCPEEAHWLGRGDWLATVLGSSQLLLLFMSLQQGEGRPQLRRRRRWRKRSRRSTSAPWRLSLLSHLCLTAEWYKETVSSYRGSTSCDPYQWLQKLTVWMFDSWRDHAQRAKVEHVDRWLALMIVCCQETWWLLLKNVSVKKKNKESGTSDDSACVSVVGLLIKIYY